MQSLPTSLPVPDPTSLPVSMPNRPNSSNSKGVKSWEVLLSESSGSENEAENQAGPRKARIKEKSICDKRQALREHDYCWEVFKMIKDEEKKEDLSEMDKILSNVALGAFEIPTSTGNGAPSTMIPAAGSFDQKSGALPTTSGKESKKAKKKKKKRKKHKKIKNNENNDSAGNSSSSDSDADIDVTSMKSKSEKTDKKKKVKQTAKKKWVPKPKYHMQGTSQQGVTAAAARPRFSSSDGEGSDDDLTSNGELASSDLDTDFSADESGSKSKRAPKPSTKAFAFAETQENLSTSNDLDINDTDEPETPSLKLKIKLPGLPATPQALTSVSGGVGSRRPQMPHWGTGAGSPSPNNFPKHNKKSNKKSAKKKRKKSDKSGRADGINSPAGTSMMSKKLRLSFPGPPGGSGKNKNRQKPTNSSDYDSDAGGFKFDASEYAREATTLTIPHPGNERPIRYQ